MKRRPEWQVAFTREFLLAPLKPAEKAVVLALAGWADQHLACDATKGQLAKASGVCERQLHGYLIELRRRGFIAFQTVRLGNRNRNVYHLLSPCGICMVRLGALTMQFPQESLQKIYGAKKGRKSGQWKITHFPLGEMKDGHADSAAQ